MSSKSISIDELAWTELPLNQDFISDNQLVEITPVTALPRHDGAPVVFHLDKVDTLTNLNDTYLWLKLQILRANGTTVEKEDNVSICNLFGYAMWRCVDIYINDQKITLNNNHFAWQSYVMSLLMTTAETRKNLLESACFELDDPNLFDAWEYNVDIDGIKNKGLIKRAKRCHLSSDFELYTRLLSDMVTDCPRYLPSYCELKVIFYPNQPTLSIMGNPNNDYIINIKDARLYVNRIKLTNSALVHQETILNRTPALLPFKRYETRTRSILAGQQNVEWNVLQGRIAQRLFIFQLSSKAYNGSYDSNIFNFDDYNIQTMQVFVNDRSLPCNGPTTFERNSDRYRFHMNNMRALGMNSDLAFSPSDISHGYFIAVYDLTLEG